MTDEQRMAVVQDWLTVRKLWMQAAQAAASQEAGASLDDFLKQHKHSPKSTDKAKK